MKEKRMKLNENTKQKLKLFADENNLHVTFRGGVPGVIDTQEEVLAIERSKRYNKPDVRSVFGNNSIFMERVASKEKSRPGITMDTFDDPQDDNEIWSDWSCGDI